MIDKINMTSKTFDPGNDNESKCFHSHFHNKSCMLILEDQFTEISTYDCCNNISRSGKNRNVKLDRS